MTLDDLRLEIDRLDDKLLELYNERMDLVYKVGELKHTTGAPIYRPEREKAILNRLKSHNKGKLTDAAIDALFLEMFAVARNLELPEGVAYLGPEASFTHQAAESKFGAMSAYLPMGSIHAIFREVNKGTAKFGVIPIENSSNGIVSDTINCLDEYDLKIIAEVMIDVHFAFATLSEDITKTLEDANQSIGKGSLGIIHGTATGNDAGDTHKVTLYLSAVQLAKFVPHDGADIETDVIDGYDDIVIESDVPSTINEDDKPEV